MILYYEKVHVIDNISYYKFSTEQTEYTELKPIKLIDNFKSTIRNNKLPVEQKMFENLVKMIKKFYKSLKKTNNEYKTLKTATATCMIHLDIDIDYANGILLEDESIIVFHDSTLEQEAYFKSIIKKGALL